MENGVPCNHKLDKLPHWRPIERQALMNSILASNPDLVRKLIISLFRI